MASVSLTFCRVCQSGRFNAAHGELNWKGLARQLLEATTWETLLALPSGG
ncbi:hypothetical protein [Deinococcus hopiensis]|uniref:Uncharacterized protein n=1 Tax=Deinococcus hopiensis KR-140 TaxID=695939 RepID=A0A1W1UJY8_9DEIO|nr:hypothetical protein [Deinococcus hopiensis]SMB81362.1 hypothetical protein SAMN00790413_04554 [Deinococcus hopiensis KR-140]